MKTLISAVVLTTLPAVAIAQECAPVDIIDAFKAASDSDLSYVVLSGKFATTLPESITEPQTLDAEFSGKLLTAEGFTDEVSAPVEIDLGCTGETCAEIDPEAAYVAFVEQQEQKLILTVDTCYTQLFPTPPGEDILRLEACAMGEACE